MSQNEMMFLEEITNLSYKYNLMLIKTTECKIALVEMNQEDKGGSYLFDKDELTFM